MREEGNYLFWLPLTMLSIHLFTYLFLNFLVLDTHVKHYQAKTHHSLHQWECYTSPRSWCQYLCYEQLLQPNATSNYQRPVIFLEGDYWLESPWSCLKWSTEDARGKHGKTTPSLDAFLLKPQCKISSMCLALLGLGVYVTSNPGKSCLATVSCPQDARSCLWCSALMEILPSSVLGGLCVSHWVYVVCIDFSIELVWSYKLRCQTHLLSQFEFIFAN